MPYQACNQGRDWYKIANSVWAVELLEKNVFFLWQRNSSGNKNICFFSRGVCSQRLGFQMWLTPSKCAGRGVDPWKPHAVWWHCDSPVSIWVMADVTFFSVSDVITITIYNSQITIFTILHQYVYYILFCRIFRCLRYSRFTLISVFWYGGSMIVTVTQGPPRPNGCGKRSTPRPGFFSGFFRHVLGGENGP